MNKYKNPIAKVQTVTIPTWDYAALVRSSTLLEVATKIMNGTEQYAAREALQAIFKDEDKGD